MYTNPTARYFYDIRTKSSLSRTTTEKVQPLDVLPAVIYPGQCVGVNESCRLLCLERLVDIDVFLVLLRLHVPTGY